MRRTNVVTLILHISIWLIIFLMPFIVVILNGITLEEALSSLKYVSIIPAAFAVIFYTNEFILIDRLLTKKRFLFFVLANAVLIHCIRNLILFVYTKMGVFQMVEFEFGMQVIMYFNFVLYSILVIGISVAFKMTRGWYKAETERSELLQQTTESELKWLKNQLNPHFLFNSLNNIYSQISIQPEKAKDSIQQLSDMLRYVLYESGETYVTLEEELKFVKNYIELMRIRMSSRVTLDVDLDDVAPGIQIIPLLYISLIENAFKHGVSASKPSFISIQFKYGSNEIFFQTKNSYFPKTVDDKGGSGIGLVNIQKRLEMIYPNRYTFTHGRVGEEYHCKLILRMQKKNKL